MYTSKTTRRNVGVSYNSQDEADLQAAQMDENDCFNCVNCVDCIGCRDCRDCRDCTDCRDCMMWHGQPASNLLSINGLRWPVSTDGDSIQIGCKHHSVEEWRSFDESVIASMDRHALGVYKAYRDTVLALADARKRM